MYSKVGVKDDAKRRHGLEQVFAVGSAPYSATLNLALLPFSLEEISSLRILSCLSALPAIVMEAIVFQILVTC